MQVRLTHKQVHLHPLLAVLAVALSAPVGAQAQNASASQSAGGNADQAATDLEAVVVTGSRIKRSEVEGPAPVTVITGEQIAKEGFVTAYDAISTLTEANGSVEGDAGWGSHTVNTSPLNLRDLGPGRSLLLINGHRAADYPLPYGGQSNFQNYTNIPAAAIERIEVLASGASAIYGSDAIAGVVNVILKKNFSGDQLRAKIGAATRGGRDLFNVSWTGGRTGERWGVVYSAQYLKRDPLFAGERKFMDSENDAHWKSWGEASRITGTRVNNYYDLARISNVYDGTRYAPPPGTCEQFGDYSKRQQYREFSNHTLGPSLGEYCMSNRFFHNWTVKDGEESASLYLHGTYDFTPTLQGWATAVVFDAEGTSSVADFGLGYVPNVFWYDQGLGAYVEGKRFLTRPEIGDALTYTNERSYDISFGLNGKLAERFDWDLSFDHIEYEVKKSYPANVPALVNQFYLGPQQGWRSVPKPGGKAGETLPVPVHTVDLNRFFSPITRADWEAMSTHGKESAESKADQVQLVFSGELFKGWAGPISFAAVAEMARQSYALHPDPNTIPVPGAVPPGPNLYVVPYSSPFYGYDFGGGTRKRWAVGAEFRVPLWQDQTPGLGSAAISLAGRYDAYDQTLDQGKPTYMAGLEWRPFETLLVRGSYATSFRAPDMHYVFAQGGESFFGLRDVLRCYERGLVPCEPKGGSDPAVDVDYRARTSRAGSPLLKYEEGQSWTAGLVWDFMEGASFSADYWNIELKNSIAYVGAGTILDAELGCKHGVTSGGTRYLDPFTNAPPSADFCNAMLSRIERGDPNNALLVIREGPYNQGGQRRSGLDLAASYRLPTDRFGNFAFSLGATRLLSSSGRSSEATEWSDGHQGARNSPFRSKVRASVGWERGRFNTTLFATASSRPNSVNEGTCTPFDNGERGEPIDDDTCVMKDKTSPNFGKTSRRDWDSVKAPLIFNLTAGYKLTDGMAVNLAVNNLFDSIAKDPYKGDYTFVPETVWSFVGREVALEYVVDF